MGNGVSKGSRNLYVAAMSNVTTIERKELLGMRAKFGEMAKASGGNPNTITRDEFTRGLDEISVAEADAEILERLFTMFDKMGDGQINYREFVVGVSPLARGDVPQKLQFAFELYDVDESGHVKAAEMCFVLNAINNVASWFGDPAMQPDEIDTCVEDVFKQAGGAMSVAYTENITVIAEHAVVRQFLAGSGTVVFGA